MGRNKYNPWCNRCRPCLWCQAQDSTCPIQQCSRPTHLRHLGNKWFQECSVFLRLEDLLYNNDEIDASARYGCPKLEHFAMFFCYVIRLEYRGKPLLRKGPQTHEINMVAKCQRNSLRVFGICTRSLINVF